MMKKRLIILLVVVYIINLTGCSFGEKNRYEAEFLQLFDTVTKIVGFANSKEEFEEYTQMIYDNLTEYHELYDIYNNYEGINNIKTINDNAGISPVKVDKRIIDLLLFSKDVYDKTEGKTNIALGAVLKIWHEYRDTGIEDPENSSLPPMDLLVAASEHTDINNMIIDEAASTVYLSDREMSLDVGAVAKGYATEQVSQITYEAGYTSGLISVGGNVRAVGYKNASGEKWNVAIQNPNKDEEENSLFTLSINDLSLVTSGNYQRYYIVNGKSYHHLIDSKTLMPAEYFVSVSIVCKDSGMADALSTAIFNMSYEQGNALVETLEDTEALWVFPDYSIKYSEGFNEFIKIK